jgi:hypothetical protein
MASQGYRGLFCRSCCQRFSILESSVPQKVESSVSTEGSPL